MKRAVTAVFAVSLMTAHSLLVRGGEQNIYMPATDEPIAVMNNTTVTETGSESSYSLGNFRKEREYHNGLFKDVGANEWYAPKVVSAYEYNIINGMGNNEFKPNGDLTIEQALKIGASIHGIYKYGAGAALNLIPETTPWYQGAADYCKKEGLIAGEFDGKIGKNLPITRAEMIHAWYKILQPKDMGKVNQVIYLPDVTEAAPYYDEIIAFYEAGIVSGSDANGTFRPNDNIKRGEVCTIFLNMLDPAARKNGQQYGSQEEAVKLLDTMNVKLPSNYIDELLSQSKGVIYNAKTGELTKDFQLTDLPRFSYWRINVELDGKTIAEDGKEIRKGQKTTIRSEDLESKYYIESHNLDYDLTDIVIEIGVANELAFEEVIAIMRYKGDGTFDNSAYRVTTLTAKDEEVKGTVNPAWIEQVLTVLK